jgi:hypothetical protein
MRRRTLRKNLDPRAFRGSLALPDTFLMVAFGRERERQGILDD